MPTNTAYNPGNVADFEKTKLHYSGQKAKGVIPSGTTGTVDLSLSEDFLFTGAIVDVVNNSADDEIKMQVVLNGSVVSTFVDWWGGSFNKELSYPAKLLAGMVLRIEYKSTGSQDVQVRANYSLHKVLE